MCNLEINEGLDFLEVHVELHFNSEMNNASAAFVPPPPSSQNDELMHFVQENRLKGTRSRTNSASSLAANVDENFEIDQVMTFADCDVASDKNNEDFYYSNGKFVSIDVFKQITRVF